MTLTLAWIRAVGGVEELVVASDSRLRPFAWDAAPKILLLPREDSVIAFAGETSFAYPMMLQVANTIACWDKAASRRQPLEELNGHLLRVINHMLEELTDVPPHLKESPNAYFLFGGFSWKSQSFQIWTLHFATDLGRFTFRPASRWTGGNEAKLLAVVGDELPEAKKRLKTRLKQLNKLEHGGFDMEPLSILAEIIDDEAYPTIGGHPQVVKIYKCLKAVPFVVERHGTRSLFGRALLDYEQSDRYPEVSLDNTSF